MPVERRPRGRPKGSGIDDRAKLREMAALIAAQPHLKPTTAIKVLGENDPSVIRRLRDKFHALQHELMAEIRRAPAPAAAVLSAPMLDTPAPRYAIEMPSRPEPARFELPRFDVRPLAPATTNAATSETPPSPSSIQVTTPVPPPAPAPRQAAPTEARDDSIAVTKERLAALADYNVMIGLAIQATVSALEQQMKLTEQTMRLPPVAAILRQQIALGEMVMAMAWPKRPPAVVGAGHRAL